MKLKKKKARMKFNEQVRTQHSLPFANCFRTLPPKIVLKLTHAHKVLTNQCFLMENCSIQAGLPPSLEASGSRGHQYRTPDYLIENREPSTLVNPMRFPPLLMYMAAPELIHTS